MSDEVQKEQKKPPRVWPGMPTRRSQMFESSIVLAPAIIVIGLALLLPLVNSCREMAMKNAGQASPLNGPDHERPN
jgi:hypothetical protein